MYFFVNSHSQLFTIKEKYIKIFDKYNLDIGVCEENSEHDDCNNESKDIKKISFNTINISNSYYSSNIIIDKLSPKTLKFNITITFNKDMTFTQSFGVILQNISQNLPVTVANHRNQKTEQKSEIYYSCYNKFTIGKELSIFIPNPYQSFFYYNANKGYIILNIIPKLYTHWKYKGEKIKKLYTHTITKGTTLNFEFFLTKNKDFDFIPVYFSSIPYGYSELWVHIFDEIPIRFGDNTFAIITDSNTIKNELIRKVREFWTTFKNFKGTFVISYDYIEPNIGYDNVYKTKRNSWIRQTPDQIIGPCNLVKYAPDSFKIWLKNLENDKGVSWAKRCGLGIHAWHHTYIYPNAKVKENTDHEFKLYDSLTTIKVIDKIYEQSEELGLTQKSRLFFRPAGLGINPWGIAHFVEKGTKLIDLSFKDENEFDITPIYSKNQKGWGIHNTLWLDIFPEQNSFPDYYYVKLHLLDGIPAQTGGHPWGMFGDYPYSSYKDKAKWQYTYKKFQEIESYCEDLGFFRADSLAMFIDQTSNIKNFSFKYHQDSIIVYFDGKSTIGQTIIIDSTSNKKILKAIYDNTYIPINNIKQKRDKTYITLLNNDLIQHKLIVKFDNSTIKNEKFKQISFETFPNPFNAYTTIEIFIPYQSKLLLSLYDVTGKKLKSLYKDNNFVGEKSIQLEMENFSSGIYILKLQLNNQTFRKKIIYFK